MLETRNELLPPKPQNAYVVNITDEEINVSWEWPIRTLDQLPKGSYAWVLPYAESFDNPKGMSEIIKKLKEEVEPMYGPQPAFRGAFTSDSAELDLKQSKLVPNKDYLLAFASFNDYGVSDLIYSKVSFKEGSGEWQKF